MHPYTSLFCCFTQFEDARDAADAIRSRDGYPFDGHRLRVRLCFVVHCQIHLNHFAFQLVRTTELLLYSFFSLFYYFYL